MSVPTRRTGRSPFMRSARRSAAVPGAPDAVTSTVIEFTRRSRCAMLLRVDPAVDELHDRVHVDLEPERHAERETVRHDVDERDQRLEVNVAPKLALALQLPHQLVSPPRALRIAVLQLLHQLRIRPQPAPELEVDA